MKMAMLKRLIFFAAAAAMVPGLPCVALAAPEVGKTVALKGAATIEREAEIIQAKVRTLIQLKDTVETGGKSRMKMLFIDESILTLASGTKADIEEFVTDKDGGRGVTIFNLLDGKLRAIVGKNEFEVHTPTVVAAARGTVIEVQVKYVRGRPTSRVVCLQGSVEVISADPAVEGIVTLGAGQMVDVPEGVPPATPDAAPEPLEEIKAEAEKDEPLAALESTATAAPIAATLPPIEQEPQETVSPVSIGVEFREQ
jgi:hypothetical protein